VSSPAVVVARIVTVTLAAEKLEPTAATWVGGVLHPARLTVLTAWIGRQIARLDLSAVPRVVSHG